MVGIYKRIDLFPEAKLNISNDSVVYGKFENYNILGKSVNNSVEPHFL